MPSAQLAPLSLTSPGFAGLNTQSSASILGPEWATEALNIVYDDVGRPAARKGWLAVTSSALGGTPAMKQVFEFIPLTGSNQVVSTTATDIYSGTTALTSIKGAIVPTAGNYKFVNYNGSVYGLQTSHALISWNGAGNFAAVVAASGSVPDGNCLLSAFGRLWASSSDGQTLKYCGLLDATNWGGVGAGSINFTNVWATGQDSIQALGSFNNYLVVFGSQNIIIIEDGTGSTLGLNPTTMVVKDVISGIGCIARDSVQNVEGDDLVFLAATGIFGLRRVLQAGGNPLRSISKNVRDSLIYYARNTTAADIRSAYIAKQGLYLLLLPTQSIWFCFSTKEILPDGTWRVSTWNGFVPNSLCCLSDQYTLYAGKSGAIFNYTGNQDNGSSYEFTLLTGWTPINDEIRDKLKSLKRFAGLFYADGLAPVTFKWAFDFDENFSTAQKSTTDFAAASEWGTFEWGLGEWGGSVGLFDIEVPGTGTGQFIRVGVTTTINSFNFALQLLQLFVKVGRTT